MLLSDAFGGFGGISKFNRDFLCALSLCPRVDRVYALPRIIPEKIDETVPEFVIYRRSSARGRLAFIFETIRETRRHERADMVICGHLHLLPMAWLAARLQGARLVLVIHGIEAWGPSNHPIANLLARRVDAFLAVSRYTATRFMRWANVLKERGFILPNCVDLDRFCPGNRDPALVARYGLQSCKVVLTVGRLGAQEQYKGFDEIIEVMPRLLQQIANLRYLIVGDGTDRARLEAKVRALGLSAEVIFAGRIPEAEKVAHYNLADVFVLPSRGEGFGIALIEAAACGVPTVGSAVDGSREALLDGQLGHLVDPTNPDELVQAITTVIRSEPPRARNNLIETLGVREFQVRVSQWIARQMQLRTALLSCDGKSRLT
jgi:glycosyltransferase involved in cell wall biosynthesis